MKTIYFQGYCPQCALFSEVQLMRQNPLFWECAACHLQILPDSDFASLLQHRGQGQFLFSKGSFQSALPLKPVGADGYPAENAFTTETELVRYLLLEVEQLPRVSLHRLIDTYADYRFNNGNPQAYLAQSRALSIDFDHEGIKSLLAERDKNEKLSKQFATHQLHDFLVHLVFPLYRREVNAEILSTMGRSPIETYLCKKHFPDAMLETLNSDPLYIRQCQRELIIDLIEIIYHNSEVVLSHDPVELLAIKKMKYDITLN